MLLPTLAKLLLPAVAILVMLTIARRKGVSLTDGVGLRRPAVFPAITFLVGWVALVAVEEAVTSSIAAAQPEAWPAYPALIIGLRVLAIGIVGPIAEELAFRGMLMAALRRTGLGIYGTVVVTAAVWAAIHVQYAPVVLLLIFVDGLALGWARHVCRSVYVPMAMHVMGNLFSVYQSLGW